uniref:Uncharacterized protein n=1 Tax=Monopterus albus TaxID=43700 RepID=A0A3Q3JDP1_MONAL
MIIQLESSNTFYEKKAGKECTTVTVEGRRAAQTGHKKHILSSELMSWTPKLTENERNDTGYKWHASPLSADCREEMYCCTRLYSVHKPLKRSVDGRCIYSLIRVYVINKEICTRTVRFLHTAADLCRELSGWPKRVERSSNRKRYRYRRSNPQTWANKNLQKIPVNHIVGLLNNLFPFYCMK